MFEGEKSKLDDIEHDLRTEIFKENEMVQE